MPSQQESLISFMRYSKEYDKAVKDLHQLVVDNESEQPEKHANEVAHKYLHVEPRELLNFYHKKYNK